jgi:hypothetical protein
LLKWSLTLRNILRMWCFICTVEDAKVLLLIPEYGNLQALALVVHTIRLLNQDCCWLSHLVVHTAAGSDCTSVSNGSGLSLEVRVLGATEPLPNWRSRLWIDLNCQFRNGSIEIPNLSALGGLSVGCSADPFVDSYNALVFAAW